MVRRLPLAGPIVYTRVAVPVAPPLPTFCYIIATERGALFLSLTADSDEALRRELTEYYRAALATRLQLQPASPVESQWWQRAVETWFSVGKVPPLDLSLLTSFQRQVSEAALRIPRGQTTSYAALAAACGRPRAARAVGQVMARNPLPLFIPCHRVVRADGAPGQYSGGGPQVKRQLLDLERSFDVCPSATVAPLPL